MRKLAESLEDTEQLGVVMPREEYSVAGEQEVDKLKGMTLNHIAGPYRPSVPSNSQGKCMHDQLCQFNSKWNAKQPTTLSYPWGGQQREVNIIKQIKDGTPENLQARE